MIKKNKTGKDTIFQELLYNEEIAGENRVNKISLIVSIIMILLAGIDFLLIESPNANMISNGISGIFFFLYHLILYFVLKKGMYKSYIKYVTVVVGTLIASGLLFGYSFDSGMVHSLRSIVVLTYFIIIALSAFYHQPKIVIFCGLFISLNYTILYYYAVYFTDTLIVDIETFYEPGISFAITTYAVPIFIVVSILLSSITKRSNFLLKRSLYSEAESKVMQEAKEAIEIIHQERTNFFINIAHETKTPLTLIMNYLDRYENTNNTTDLDVVRDNVGKLISDIVNLLDSEKLLRGQVFYEHNQTIDISDLINIKIDQFSKLAELKHINITKDIESKLFVEVDPVAIDRIINNVMDNAIKYTNENGSIDVKLLSNNFYIEIIISDNGIGIAEDPQKNIFSPYFQASHEKRNIQGLGMGLFIVKQIIDNINGIIEIDSRLGSGTTLSIRLKKRIGNEQDQIQNSFDLSTPTVYQTNIKLEPEIIVEGRKSILVVEDNPELLSYIKTELSGKYNVYSARNGMEALNKVKDIPELDLIISDVMMDIMDGITFCGRVRDNIGYAHIPFIFLTAKTANDAKFAGFQVGAIDYICKPFSMDLLKFKIENILNQINMVKENIVLRYKNNGSGIFENKCDALNLSKREREVIKALSCEPRAKYKDIAVKLNFKSESTVSSYMHRIYLKINDNNIKLGDINGKVKPNKFSILSFFNEQEIKTLKN